MVKIGDKVRVATDDYPTNCPRGTICTVVADWNGSGEINATIDGGDGFSWNFIEGQYKPIADGYETVNYAEQSAKYGISITVRAGALSVTYDGKK